MECPFELPVKKEILPRNTKNIDLYRIEGAYFPYTKDEVDYIVQAINIHEQLVEALEYITEKMECPAVQCVGDWQTGMFCGLEDRDITDRYDACIYGYEMAIERINEWALCGIKQALEAEKKK